jgi:hypothetical protein
VQTLAGSDAVVIDLDIDRPALGGVRRAIGF